ncbi:MAG: Hsp20 family protein [Alphaproteobacteria bacterium]|nr:Hsp20 family protein [Alphaproteobacteria bacterium]
MRTYDLTPLLRSTIGFDRFNWLLEAGAKLDENALSYPPYNIEKTGEDDYRITMAVAGFSAEDIDVTAKENTLVISGKALPEREGAIYLHRGVAGRAFERRFELADTIKVVGASLENGLLHVDLVREIPEALKPRRIAIEAKAA